MMKKDKVIHLTQFIFLLHRIRIFQKSVDYENLIDEEIEVDDDEDKKKGKKVKCLSCNHLLTNTREKINIAGRHQHTFTNPQGVTFTIRCFRLVEGAVTYGVPTQDYTWFPGFAWNFAMCGKCNTHIGWGYQAGHDGFFGLIQNKIYETDD